MDFFQFLTARNRFPGGIRSEKTYQYVYNCPFGDFGFFHLENRPKLAIWAKNGEFGQNMKNLSKNRVFHTPEVKFGLFDEFCTYKTDVTYRK